MVSTCDMDFLDEKDWLERLKIAVPIDRDGLSF